MSNKIVETEIVSDLEPTLLKEEAVLLSNQNIAITSDDRPKKFAGRGDFSKKRGGKRGGAREERTREFDQKILSIRRVTRVAAGGRRFNFSVAIVLGDKKGRVGVGTGKAGDTALAIEKATRSAKKAMIKLVLTKHQSIPHKTEAKYSSARIMMMPALGRGLIAGSAARDVLVLGGVRDVVAKIFSGSKNPLNIAQATIKALSSLSLEKRISVSDQKVKTESVTN